MCAVSYRETDTGHCLGHCRGTVGALSGHCWGTAKAYENFENTVCDNVRCTWCRMCGEFFDPERRQLQDKAFGLWKKIEATA